MTGMHHQGTSEFSRPVTADSVSPKDRERRIEATAEERRALAARLSLNGLDRLVADITMRRVRGEMIRVHGRIEADVVQTCVVTLEPFASRVEGEFEELFAPPEQIPDLPPDTPFDPLAEDIPEPIENGRIDLGELVTQHLSLALDPYPHAPGVAFQDIDEGGEEEAGAAEPERPNPFAVLAKLKSGKRD